MEIPIGKLSVSARGRLTSGLTSTPLIAANIDDINAKFKDAGIATLESDKRWGSYRPRLTQGDVEDKQDVLREQLHLAPGQMIILHP